MKKTDNLKLANSEKQKKPAKILFTPGQLQIVSRFIISS